MQQPIYSETSPASNKASEGIASVKGAVLPIRLRDVCYRAGGATLLDRLTFDLQADTRTVLLGPNGAGKSLTLRICHGLISPTSGTITWQDSESPPPPRQQAMVFQRPVLLRRTARANVEYALALNGVTRRERGGLAMEYLERTGLAPLAERQARTLSAGEQQRLALARAWALQPRVLYLDEPTSSLDPSATEAVEAIIKAIHESETKILLTTHDLGQAHRLADEVLFLHRGCLLERSAAAAFFSGPATSEARAFLKGELFW